MNDQDPIVICAICDKHMRIMNYCANLSYPYYGICAECGLKQIPEKIPAPIKKFHIILVKK